jgi:hypothetical protein
MASRPDTGIWAFIGFVAIFVTVEIFKLTIKKGFRELFRRKNRPAPALAGRPPEIRPETRLRFGKRRKIFL